MNQSNVNWNRNVAQITFTDEQKKLVSDAYQHLVDAAKLLSEPAMLEAPNISKALDLLKQAEGAVGSILD